MPPCATLWWLGWSAAATPSRWRCCCCGTMPAPKRLCGVRTSSLPSSSTCAAGWGGRAGARARVFASPQTKSGGGAPPASTRTSRYVYPRWAQRWPITWLRIFIYYLLTYPYTMVMARPRVRGRERLRGADGPLLFVSNHVAYIDIGFVMAALPLRYRTRLAVAMQGE